MERKPTRDGIILSKIYLSMISQVIRDIKEGTVFIDIGAHTGEELEYLAPLGAEVHSFEPNIEIFNKYLFPKYGDLPNVHLYNAAAWNRDGMINLYMHESKPEKHVACSVIKEKVNVSKTDFIEVPCIDIGQFILNLNKDIDYLKIDAEGAEFYILESIINQVPLARIKNWFVEDHQHKIDGEEWLKKKEVIGTRIRKSGVVLQTWI